VGNVLPLRSKPPLLHPPFDPFWHALIFLALGSGILFSYPELATIAGVQGLVIYALASALPLLIFAILGPIIRRKCPEGFVLTEWTRQRYGLVAALYLSFMTLVTLFLYMVAELSAVGQVVKTLTGMDGLPVVIVECVITTIYTGTFPPCLRLRCLECCLSWLPFLSILPPYRFVGKRRRIGMHFEVFLDLSACSKDRQDE
jgi:hypothetical protein